MVSPVNPMSSGRAQALPDATDARSNRGNAAKPESLPEQVSASWRIVTAEDGIAILRKRLEQRMQAFDIKVGRPALGELERPSAVQVANRILGFVEARLAREQASGADPERLEKLLAQAREGVTKGFSEAKEQIQALGMMTDELEGDIGDSFARVNEGLNRLGERISINGTPEAIPGGSVVNYESASRQQLAFEVFTRDGDRVTVTVDERRFQSAALAGSASGDDAIVASSSTQMFAGRYAFAVEGELDSGELKALGVLFEGAQSVSERFFSGDVLGAFEEVQSLGLNGDELTSYSLNLSYARVSRATSYAEVASQPASPLSKLSNLAEGFRELSERAVQANVAEPQLVQLMERTMAEAQQRAAVELSEPVESLMNRFWQAVIAQLAADRDTDATSDN
ncbi:DUF5610 domain-containing protein [Marinobacter sp.]|uniref:DUF5610 domain-containing protein n=1 Tax=Marinobacter sp. TaxID=50741 RepID=UPI0034A0A647